MCVWAVFKPSSSERSERCDSSISDMRVCAVFQRNGSETFEWFKSYRLCMCLWAGKISSCNFRNNKT